MADRKLARELLIRSPAGRTLAGVAAQRFGDGHTLVGRRFDVLLGSLEFACALAETKVVLVMGHTACGAIKGAIDGAKLGHLTGLLDKIKPAVQATEYAGERSSKNDAFVDEVAKSNVRLTIDEIRQRSKVLAGLENDGKIKVAASMYHLIGGRVEFLT